ncbi:MAG: 30S ribosomal protein S17 [Mycobacterium sp.]|uniref:30S ribosomal protein S17 n=1 Tax=Mycobacterium sp. TaxID=1785 RepID=UPI003BAE845F
MAEAKTPQKSAAKKAPAKATPKKAAATTETAGGATPADDAGRRPAEKAGNGRGPKHTPRTPKPRGQRKTRIGYVVSDKMQKTIVVELEDRMRHPLYGKIIRTTKKVKAHDENSVAGIGDRVSLMETRPLSATKRWRLVAILEKAK